MNSHSESVKWSGFIPFQLVSLADMLIKYPFDEMRCLLSGMQAIQAQLESTKEEDIDADFLGHLSDRIIEYEKLCKTFEIEVSSCISRLTGKIRNPASLKYPVSTYWIELRHRINDELEQHLWMYLERNQVEYFNQEMLFGEEVYDNFPTARDDIREAGNCYATGAYTASVFHLMRAAEVGAKAMIRALKAQKYIGGRKMVKGKMVFQRKSIELCDWQTLIRGLREAYKGLDKKSSTSVKRKATLAFYSEALSQFEYLKNGWRNSISHGHEVAPDRRFFLQGETEDIIKNTRHFMRHLAKRVTE